MFLRESLFFNFSFSFLSSFFILLVNLVTKVLLANYLSVNDFAEFIMIQNSFTFIIYICSISMNEYLVSYFSQNKLNEYGRGIILTSILVSILPLILASIIFQLSQSRLLHIDVFVLLTGPIFYSVLIAIFFKNLLDLLGASFQGNQRLYIKTIFVDLIPAILFLVVICAAYIFSLSLSGLMVSIIYFIIISAPILFLPRPFNLSILTKAMSFSYQETRNMFSFSFPLYLAGFLMWVLNLLPNIIGQYSSAQTVAYYSIGNSLTIFSFIALATVDLAAFSAWSTKIKKHGILSISEDVKKYTNIAVFLGSLIFSILYIEGDTILELLFDDKYFYLSNYIGYFAIVNFLTAFFGPTDAILKASKDTAVFIYGRIIMVIFVLLSSSFLIQNFDLLGAIVLLFIGMLIMKIVNVGYIYYKYSIHPFSKDLIILSLIIFISINCISFLNSMHNLGSFISIFLSFTGYLLIASILSRILRMNFIDDAVLLLSKFFKG